MSQPNQQQPEITLKDGANFTYAVACMLSWPCLMFTRCQFGSEAFGKSAFCAFIMLMLMASSARDQYIPFLFVLWCVFLLTHRMETFKSWRNGVKRHSLYVGDPWLAMLFVKDMVAARWLEPILCAGIALLLRTASKSLSEFLLVCSAGVFIRTGMEMEAFRRQVRSLRDAEIEQQHLIDAWRQDRGGF